MADRTQDYPGSAAYPPYEKYADQWSCLFPVRKFGGLPAPSGRASAGLFSGVPLRGARGNRPDFGVCPPSGDPGRRPACFDEAGEILPPKRRAAPGSLRDGLPINCD